MHDSRCALGEGNKVQASRSRNIYGRIKKAIATWCAVAFLFNVTIIDYRAWAVEEDYSMLTGSSMGGGDSPGLNDLNLEKIELPLSLGNVKKIYKADSQKPVVIYLQDAHCNYSCQKSIESIIGYFRNNYGIDIALVEGGAGNYDFSIFTGIPDIELREKIADYFVREGRVTGVELYAILNPDKLTVKGLEEQDLYDKNLSVYRESLGFKENVDKYLEILKHFIRNLKPPIFSEKIKEFDEKKSAYDNNKNNLRDYILYLGDVSKKENIKIAQFGNMNKLLKLMEEEKGINFKRADKEKEILLDSLARKLSKIEMATLVEKSIELKKNDISAPDFYEYFFRKAYSCSIPFEEYVNLGQYKEYLDRYDAVEKDVFFEEIFDVERYIAENLLKTEDERSLFYLDDDLYILEKLFSASLTRQLYDYYIKKEKELSADKFIKFIQEKASWYKMPASVNPDVAKLDSYKDKMGKFYYYSFERDKAFMVNIDKYAKNQKAILIVTGGFHTESMTDLLKQNGYSYALITPRIITQKDNPYFHLLSGGLSPIETLLSEYTAVLALRSVFSEMGIKTESKAMQEAVSALSELVESKRDYIILDMPLGIIKLTFIKPTGQAGVDYVLLNQLGDRELYAVPLVELEGGAVKVNSKEITHDTLSYGAHEVYDILRRWAFEKTNGFTSVDARNKEHVVNIERILQHLVYLGIISDAQKTIIYRNIPSEIEVYLAGEGARDAFYSSQRFELGHASYRNIWVSYRGDSSEALEKMGRKFLHELGAYWGMSSAFNDNLEKNPQGTLPELFGAIKSGEAKPLEEGPKEGRDLAGAVEYPPTLEPESQRKEALDEARIANVGKYTEGQMSIRAECAAAIRPGFRIPVILEVNERMFYSTDGLPENMAKRQFAQQLTKFMEEQVQFLTNYDGEIELVVSYSRDKTINKIGDFIGENRRPVVFRLDAFTERNEELNSLLQQNQIPSLMLRLKEPTKEDPLGKSAIEPFSLAQLAILMDALDKESKEEKPEISRIKTLKSDMVKIIASLEMREIQKGEDDFSIGKLYNSELAIWLPRITELGTRRIEEYRDALQKIEKSL